MKEGLLKIINHYGVNHQCKKLNEECYELLEAIIKFEETKRDCFEYYGLTDNNTETKACITEEFADVLVMLKQFQYYYEIDKEELKKIIQQKIKRQSRRIKEGE